MRQVPSRNHSGSTIATMASIVGAALLSLLALAGCGSKPDGAATVSQASASNATGAPSSAGGGAHPFKIGVMVGTVSQGEDEFRAGQMVVKKYGEDRVKMVTYPDNFMQEQETVIGQLVGLASDPAVKVIVLGQAVPGTVAGLRKLREDHLDMLSVSTG